MLSYFIRQWNNVPEYFLKFLKTLLKHWIYSYSLHFSFLSISLAINGLKQMKCQKSYSSKIIDFETIYRIKCGAGLCRKFYFYSRTVLSLLDVNTWHQCLHRIAPFLRFTTSGNFFCLNKFVRCVYNSIFLTNSESFITHDKA